MALGIGKCRACRRNIASIPQCGSCRVRHIRRATLFGMASKALIATIVVLVVAIILKGF